MAETKKKKTKKFKGRYPVGADGLTKYQRYYRKKKLANKLNETEPSVEADTKHLLSESSGVQSPRPIEMEPESSQTNFEGAERTGSGSSLFPRLTEPMQHAVLSPTTDAFLLDTPEPVSSRGPSSFNWRVPTQIIPISDDPGLPDQSFSKEFGDYEAFLRMRNLVALWSRYWNGMAQWPEALDAAFQRHRENGPEGVHIFIRKLWYHEQRGRQLLHSIQAQQAGISLPSNPEALMMLWNLQQDQVMVLTRGLTIMELTGSMALRYLSIGNGEFDGAVPSALFAPDTGLYPTRRDRERETETDEDGI